MRIQMATRMKGCVSQWGVPAKKSITVTVIACMVILTLATACVKETAPPVEPVVIGAPCSMGVITNYQMADCATLAGEEINKESGGVLVNGQKRPLKIVSTDTRDLEPTIPIQDVVLAYQNLISSSQPAALVGGPIRTEAQMAVMENLASTKMIHIFGGGINLTFQQKVAGDPAKYKYLFKNSPSPAHQIKTMLQGMDAINKRLGYNTVFFFIEDVDYARAGGKIAAAALENMGWQVKGQVNTPLGLTDYSSALLELKKSGAQVLFFIYSSEAGTLTKQFEEMRMSAIPYGAGTAFSQPESWKASNGALENWICYVTAGHVATPKMPKATKFLDAFKARFGEELQIILGGSQSYDGVYMLAEAINATGSLDPDKLAAYLEKIEYAGTLGLTKFPADHQAPYTDDPATGLVNLCFQWQDGKRVVVYPTVVSAGELRTIAR